MPAKMKTRPMRVRPIRNMRSIAHPFGIEDLLDSSEPVSVSVRLGPTLASAFAELRSGSPTEDGVVAGPAGALPQPPLPVGLSLLLAALHGVVVEGQGAACALPLAGARFALKENQPGSHGRVIVPREVFRGQERNAAFTRQRTTPTLVTGKRAPYVRLRTAHERMKRLRG
jgi:hypothetical protein